MLQTLSRILLTVISVSMLASCTLFSTDLNTDSPVVIPGNWESTDLQEKITQGWLSQFNDKTLNTHVRTALRNNFDLKVNLEQLNAAIANARATNANLFPDITAGLERSRNKNFTINSEGIATAQYTTRYQADLGISWEIDIWNKLSDLSRAAALDAEVQAATYQAARLSLAANVCTDLV